MPLSKNPSEFTNLILEEAEAFCEQAKVEYQTRSRDQRTNLLVDFEVDVREVDLNFPNPGDFNFPIPNPSESTESVIRAGSFEYYYCDITVAMNREEERDLDSLRIKKKKEI